MKVSDWILVRSFYSNCSVAGMQLSGCVSLVEADPDLVPVVTRRATYNLTAQIYALFRAMRREKNCDFSIVGHGLRPHGAQAVVRNVKQLHGTDPLVIVSEVRIVVYGRDATGDYVPRTSAAIYPHGVVALGGTDVLERHLC